MPYHYESGSRAFVAAGNDSYPGCHERLAELRTDLNDPLTMSTWIESTPGAYFSVHFSCDQFSCFVRLLIDGKQQKKWHLRVGERMCLSTIRTGEHERRPFVFSKTKVTDDEDLICSDNTIINGLGTIVLEVKRIEENGMDLRSQNNRSGQRFEPSITDNTFHESKLKLLSNCVGLGEAVFQPARPFTQRNPMPKWDVIEEDRGRLWLRFVFHYRAGSVLEMLGYKKATPVLAPTQQPTPAYTAPQEQVGGWSPEPSPAAQVQPQVTSLTNGNGDIQYLATAAKQLPGDSIVVNDSDDEDDQETIQLRARINAVKEENARLRERAESVVVKRERMDSAPAELPPSKRGKGESNGEVYDLTGEDDD